jgi:hypothetical protein
MRTKLWKNIIIPIILFLFFWIGACQEKSETPVSPQDFTRILPSLSARVNRAVATTGDVIRFEITLETKPDQIQTLAIPQIGDQIMGFRIIDEGQTGPLRREGRMIATRWYDLRADIVGSYRLPEVSLEFDQNTLKTPQIFVEVKSVLPKGGEEEQQLRDIKPLSIKTMPFWQKSLFVLGGVFLFGLLLVGLIWAKRWSQRQREKTVIPADQWALEQLTTLRNQLSRSWSDLIQDPEIRKTYYFGVNEIIRAYLEKRFDFSATDFTREEILPHLKKQVEKSQLTMENRKSIDGFLHDTDLIKFTDIIPNEEDPERVFNLAKRIVQRTKAVVPLNLDFSGKKN